MGVHDGPEYAPARLATVFGHALRKPLKVATHST
jgi:hypothetical protein